MLRVKLALLLASSSLAAADSNTVLRAARLFDGRSDRLIAPAVVLVTNNRITAINPSGPIPTGAKVIDLGDTTLFPGLMDAHTHLSMPFERDYRNAELGALRAYAFPQSSLTAEQAHRSLHLHDDSFIDDCNAGRPLERPHGKAMKLVVMRRRGVGRLVEE